MTIELNAIGLGPAYSAPVSLSYDSPNDETTLDCGAADYFYPYMVGKTLYFTSAPTSAQYVVKGIQSPSNIHRHSAVTLFYASKTGTTQVTLSSGTFDADIDKIKFWGTGNVYAATYMSSTWVDVPGDITGTETDHEISAIVNSENCTFADDDDVDGKVVVVGDASGQSGTFRITGHGDTYNSQKNGTTNYHATTTLKVGSELDTTLKKLWAWLQFTWEHLQDFAGSTVNHAELQLEVSSSANVRSWIDESATGGATKSGAVINVSADTPDLSGVIGTTSLQGTANATWTASGTTITLPGSTDLSGVNAYTDVGDMAFIRLAGATKTTERYSEWFPITAKNDGADTVTVVPAPSNTESGGADWIIWNRDCDIMWLEGATGGDVPGLGDEYFTIASVNDGTDEVTLNVSPGGTLTGNWNIGEPIATLTKIHEETDLNVQSTTAAVSRASPPDQDGVAWKTTGGDYRGFDKYLTLSWPGDVLFRLTPTSGTTLKIGGTSSNSNIAGQTAAAQHTALQATQQLAVDDGDDSMGFLLRGFTNSWDNLDASVGPAGASNIEYKSSDDATEADRPKFTLNILADVFFTQGLHGIEQQMRPMVTSRLGGVLQE